MNHSNNTEGFAQSMIRYDQSNGPTQEQTAKSSGARVQDKIFLSVWNANAWSTEVAFEPYADRTFCVPPPVGHE